MSAQDSPARDRERDHVGVVRKADAAYRRKKASAACQVCRARRTKCDEERPCGFCRRSGSTCTTSPQLHTLDPGSLKILERIDVLQQSIDSLHQHVAQEAHEKPGLPGSVSVPTVSATAEPLRDVSVAPETLESLLEWAVWQGSASYIRPLHSPSSLSNPISSSFEGGHFDFATSAAVIDSFLQNCHVKNPILDQLTIRTQIRNASLNGMGWDAGSCLLLLVLANGALEQSFKGPSTAVADDPLQVAATLYNAAQKRLCSLQCADHLIQAKCWFYSGVYLMSMLRPFDAWRQFLQALATCQAFRALPTNSHPTTEKNPEEESLYWSCWKSERELRIELGLPDFTSAGLAHPQMFPSLPVGVEGEHLTAWYFYLAEISLWRMETAARRSMKEYVKTKPNASLEDFAVHVSTLEQPLISWKDTLPPAIGLDDDGNTPDILRFVLRGRLTYNYELLTWPFVCALINDELHGNLARQLGFRGLQVHIDRIQTNKPGFTHRHHGTWLMQRSSARSGCILMAAARVLAPQHLPTTWAESVDAVIDMLNFWRNEPTNLGQIADWMAYEANHGIST